MQMSNRITGFQCSPIRRLVPYSRLAGEKGIHVIHLNIGQPDIKTPKEAIDAIHSYDKDIIEYGISEGEVPLRRGLVHYYSKYGLSVNEEDIMITTGGSEAIQFVLMTTPVLLVMGFLMALLVTGKSPLKGLMETVFFTFLNICDMRVLTSVG